MAVDRIVDQDGHPCTLQRRIPATEQDEARVVLRLEDGREVTVEESLLQWDEASRHYVLPYRLRQIQQEMAAGTRVVPVLAERLEIEKRPVESGRVRLSKVIREHEETVDLPLMRERVEIQRVPKGEPVESAPPVRREGDVTIVPVVEEVLVVEKRLMLKEEIHLRRHRDEVHDPQRVTVRREEAHVERLEGETG